MPGIGILKRSIIDEWFRETMDNPAPARDAPMRGRRAQLRLAGIGLSIMLSGNLIRTGMPRDNGRRRGNEYLVPCCGRRCGMRRDTRGPRGRPHGLIRPREPLAARRRMSRHRFRVEVGTPGSVVNRLRLMPIPGASPRAATLSPLRPQAQADCSCCASGRSRAEQPAAGRGRLSVLNGLAVLGRY